MTRAGPAVYLSAALAGLGALSAVLVLAYLVSPLAAAALPVAAIIAGSILLRPLWGVYAALLAVPLEILEVRVGGDAGLSPSEAVLLLAGGMALVQGLSGDRSFRPHFAHLALGLLIVVMAVGLIVAEDRFLVVKAVIMWTAFLALSILVASASAKDADRVLIALAVAGGIAGLIAIVTTGEQELVFGGTVANNRAQATFEHSNVLAFFLLLSIPPALALASRGAARLRIPMLVSAGLALAGLLLTLSRGAIVGLGLALLVLLAWRPYRRTAVVLLAVIAAFAVTNFEALSSADQLTVVGDRLSTLTNPGVIGTDPRFGIWASTPAIILDHPLIGVGTSNFGEVAPGYGLSGIAGISYLDHPHNILLTIAAETGFVGLAFALVFAFAVGSAGVVALRERHDPRFPLVLAVCAALAGLALTSMGEYPIRTNVIMATLMIEVGVLIAYARRQRERGPGAEPVG